MIISNIRIVKRTFEGLTDETKNDNPITSKYMTSKKYVVLYDAEGYAHNPICSCVRSKRDALEYAEQLRTENTVAEEA